MHLSMGCEANQNEWNKGVSSKWI